MTKYHSVRIVVAKQDLRCALDHISRPGRARPGRSHGKIPAMSRKRLAIYALLVCAFLALSVLAVGMRELLAPTAMPKAVEALRHDSSQVVRWGIGIAAWGVLLLIFCWYLRMRNLWFIFALVVIFYGVMFYITPEQSLALLKRIYLTNPANMKIAAAVKLVVGGALLASLKYSG